MKDKVVVIGGGGHAKVVISVLKSTNQYEIIGYTDRINKGQLLSINYAGTDKYLHYLIEEYPECKAALAIGSVKLHNQRQAVFERIKSMGFSFPLILAPSAVLSENVSIGEGTIVLESAVVETSCTIGKCVIVNSNATIGHDCKIGDYTHVALGAKISGGVNIGHSCVIGTGSSIIQDISIVDNVLIGVGSVVTKNINEPGVYVGAPVRRM